jgi:hypothetical protein
MIEHWCHEIDEYIKREAGIMELSLYDHAHDRYETYCETFVLFIMFGNPRAGYDLGQKVINNFIVQDLLYRLHISNTPFKEE